MLIRLMLGLNQNLLLRAATHQSVCVRGNKAKAATGGAAGGKAKAKGKSAGKVVHAVEEDTVKLTTQVCGLNYALEGPLSEPILIKEDSEYPDWLFKMDVKRPKPTLEEMDPNTKEYWLEAAKQKHYRHIRLNKLKLTGRK
eukprot:TRINITY_DN68473_c0_g1_i1.p1 TRINITY_DN68473_c0_g1~~TRINITY_DN68473_c0_g1_i1.p1  ORF type:complete len:152 (-),score=30.63 TRINITY_DN68473_c0_g1_i1:137-559(-)